MHSILSETPGYGLKQQMLTNFGGTFSWDDVVGVPEQSLKYGGSYYLIYFGNFRPSFRNYHFADDIEYEVEVIDTWEMKITNMGRMKGDLHIDLPGKEYMAIRIKAVN